MDGKSYRVIDYCELVTPITAETIGYYESDFYLGKPAVLRNRYKKGVAYYIACRDTGELLEKVYTDILKEAGIRVYDLPFGVSCHTREDRKNIYLFMENYTKEEKRIFLNDTFIDMESKKKI